MPKPTKWIFEQPKGDFATFDPVEIVQCINRFPTKPEMRVVIEKEFDTIYCRWPNQIRVIEK